MKIKSIKGRAFFWLITLVLFSLIGFLGFRTVEHQVLLNRYQVEDQAKLQINKTSQFIWHVLSQKATRLDAITRFLQLNNASINEFISKDTEVNQLFILDGKQLIFPYRNEASIQVKQFIEEINPIIEDPYLLYAPNIQDEQAKPASGWYVNYNRQIPLLIYWCKKDKYIIGFNVSYVSLLTDIINKAQFEDNNGVIKIFENDRLLYQSDTKPYTLLATQNLSYPLNNWQINYYAQVPSSLTIYLWGGAIVSFLLIFVGVIMFSLYREYTQANRQALQQVNFVSQVSHELKTPLTNITLYAELLSEEFEQSNVEQKAYTDIIIQESQRLSRLIQNILSFTKTPKVYLKLFDLSEILQELATSFTPSFNSKEIELIVTIPQNIMIVSDADRVIQIICNFLSNAEKYAFQGKRIDLCVLVDSIYIDINVRDYGIGIANKEQEVIFKPFYRIKSSITEGVAGTGIGLTIAKQLAISIDAKILITNMQPGACFTLRLKRNLKESLK